MLKISVRDDTPGKSVLIQVEGRLAGAWVEELERFWDMECSRQNTEPITVSLANVTFIDGAGKQLLSKIFHAGAKLEGNGCMVRAIIAAITGASFSGEGCRGEHEATNAVESRGDQGESNEHKLRQREKQQNPDKHKQHQLHS